MELRLGTIGWSFPDWKGAFYPTGTKDELTFYATQFDTVEIDSTYYRIPSVKTVEEWRKRTPEGFIFSPKLSRRITQERRLEDAGELVSVFTEHVALLGERLGPMVIQLPPNFTHREFDKLEAFLWSLPAGLRYAVEFRHRSWTDQQDVVDLLRTLRIAMVETYDPRYIRLRQVTTDFIYLRLLGRQDAFPTYGHLQQSQDEVLNECAQSLTAQPSYLRRAYVFVSNHFEGHAPATAQRLRERIEGDAKQRAA